MMKLLKVTLFMISIFFITACSNSAEETYEEIDISAEEEVNESETIITINGDDVDGKAYNEMYLQVKTIAERVENDTNATAESLREETIHTLINNILFLQLAEEKGISVDRSDMEEDIKQLKKLDDEGYRELKDKFNYTDAGIANQIRLEKARKDYIDSFVSIEVTKEEVKEFYDETVASTEEDLPDFDSAYETLKERLEVKAALDEVAEQIEAYKEESDIIIH